MSPGPWGERPKGRAKPIAKRLVSGSPCLAPYPLSDEAAEPVLETRRADARVIAGGEALIVQLCAEVARVDVCGHLPRILGCAQESSDEFVETYPFRTRQFDRAVQRFLDCDIGQRGSDIIRRDGLRKGRRQPNRLPVGSRLGDAAHELEELR